MENKSNQCFKCDGTYDSEIIILYGYNVCEQCKSKMGLHQDKTLRKYVADFQKAREIDANEPSFEDEMKRRLNVIEKDYISKKIKLLHVLDRLNHI